MPIDYSKGKIYKIVDLDTDECYIGSTCEPTLARRLAKHVDNFKSYKSITGNFHYITSFKILENNNYDIQLIENYPCGSKDELHAREGYWIKKTDCVNKHIAGRTKKQWEEDNKEKISVEKKEYYKQNKGKIQEYKKKYRIDNKDKLNKRINCSCGGKYKQQNKSHHEKTIRHREFLES